MRIALDYDGTFTADPLLWTTFVHIARQHGHEVVCVTMRHPAEGIECAPFDAVIYTGRKAKKSFMEAIGCSVDVWIDDSPVWIIRDSL
jgi:hypothetical protein